MSGIPHPSPGNSPWPHRAAVVLVWATFPLIWMGGLVTTYDAGMAVPDWPTTYGYNLFLYPWQTWVFGPWDVFIEHGHRLLGALVGLLTIGFVLAVFLRDQRGWLKVASLAALAAVVFQGVLGGQRVLLDDRTLAMIHGCFGPAFFAFCAALAVVTSRWWSSTERDASQPDASRLALVALATTLLAYVQLVLGAQLRHVPEAASPAEFRMVVLSHLVVAAVVTLHVAWLAVRAFSRHRSQPLLARPAFALAALVLVQLALGGGTWVVKYGWPAFLSGSSWAQGHLSVRDSLPHALVTTGHVATGSLILAVAVVLALRAARLSRLAIQPAQAGPALPGVAR